MRRALLVVAALAATALAAATAPPSATGRPSFAGRWTLDLTRSRIDQTYFRGVTGGVLQIRHEEPSFSFRRVLTIAGRGATAELTLTTDGSEVAGDDHGTPTRSSLRWAGAALVLLTVLQAPRGEARNTVTHRLENAGRRLVVEESFRAPRLRYDNLWVYTRDE